MTADFSTRPHRGRFRVAELLLLALAGAAFAWSAFAALAAGRELERARNNLTQMRARAQQDQKRVQQIQAGGRASGGSLAYQAFQTVNAPPSRVLGDLAAAVPEAARLENLTLTYGREAVLLEIRLLTRTPATYDEFVARVGRSGRFDGLSFGSEKRTADMKVSLRARYRGEEAR